MSNQKKDLLWIKGEELVGLDFNPSGDSTVQEAKQLCANLANLMNQPAPFMKDPDPSATYELLYQQAMMDILKAQMMVVKVLTFKY